MRLRLPAFVDGLEEWLKAGCLGLMTLVTFVQVVLRYVFGAGFVWSLELTTYLFAWLVLVGMAYGIRTRTHIVVDLMTARLGERAGRAVALLALALCIGYCLLMAYGSAAFVGRLFMLGNDARDIALPRWLLTAVMPLGFVLLAVRLLEAGWRHFRPPADPSS